jgi:hypothetical protein
MTCTGLSPTSTGTEGALDELTAAVDAAQLALGAAVEREYDEECALHRAHQAAQGAPPEQLAQADAWCAAATEQLHQAILDVQRATARRDAARAALARYIARAARSCASRFTTRTPTDSTSALSE